MCIRDRSIHGDVVIKNVSLCSERGRVIGLRGINGSGKTMLMRLISGLIRPTKGQVLIDGEVVSKDIPFPRSLGVLIEGPAFLDDYSAMDNLKLIAYPKGKVTEDEIKAVLSEVRLDPKSRKKYKKFSLGMKQRLGIAAAVMEHPDLILLDEPTNALDESGVDTVSYTHLDVYKRQPLTCAADITLTSQSRMSLFCRIMRKKGKSSRPPSTTASRSAN